MRNKMHAMCAFVPIVLFFATACFADNPIVQTIFTADPGPMVYNGRIYLYTGHDSTGATNYVMGDWRCFSSADMVNWTDHGSPLSQKSFSWASTTFPRAWASQCVPRNGKFYWYICTWCVNCAINNNNMQIGVAVSNSPTGPFKDTLGHALVTSGTTLDIDPSVWIDSSGQAYLYWGHTNPFYVLLNQDMISYSGTVHTVSTTTGFGPASGSIYTEGPWFMKRNGLYYLAYAASCCPEQLAYSTSTSPTGPWTYRSVPMPAQGASFTNQAGIIDFMGSSYFFYHDGALPGGNGYQRSVCVEKFTYNADGTIPTIPMTTAGPPQVGNLNPYDTTQAETICWESGIKTEVCSDVGGGIDVDSIHNGDYIKVKGVNFGSGASSFIARVASATTGGSIELHLDSQTGTLVGTCTVAGTGGWQTWATRTCTVTGATGIHDLYLRFTGGTGLLFNFNWWKFTSATEIRTDIGKTGEGENSIKIGTAAGKIVSLLVDFSQPIPQGNLNICLFDLTGRLVATLFNGRLSSDHLTLPLDRAEIRTGAYMLRISLDNNILINNSMIFNK